MIPEGPIVTITNFDPTPVVRSLREIADLIESRKAVVISGAVMVNFDGDDSSVIRVDSNLVVQRMFPVEKGGA